MRLLDSSGSEIVGSGYDRASLALFAGSSFQQYKNENSSEWLYIPSLYINNTLLNSFTSFYVYNAEDTGAYTYITAQGGDNVSGFTGIKSIAILKDAAAHRGFSIKYVTGTSDDFTGGTITVYGVR